MKRRASLGELRYPNAPGDRAVAVAWAEAIVETVLELVWRAFDELFTVNLCNIDLATHDLEQLERELVQWHFKYLLDQWKAESFGPFTPGLEVFEFARRAGGNAVPPSNDLAFIHNARLTWKLPVEAKVVPTEGAIAEYLKDLHNKFIPGIAAPFVGEGGQIAYLLKGDANQVINALGRKLNQQMVAVASFASRPHRTSTHDRTSSPRIRIHHMVMSCVPQSALPSPAA